MLMLCYYAVVASSGMQCPRAAPPAANPVLKAAGGRAMPLDDTEGGIVQVPLRHAERQPKAQVTGLGFSLPRGRTAGGDRRRARTTPADHPVRRGHGRGRRGRGGRHPTCSWSVANGSSCWPRSSLPPAPPWAWVSARSPGAISRGHGQVAGGGELLYRSRRLRHCHVRVAGRAAGLRCCPPSPPHRTYRAGACASTCWSPSPSRWPWPPSGSCRTSPVWKRSFQVGFRRRRGSASLRSSP